MATKPDFIVEFVRHLPAPAVVAMREVLDKRDGWINFQPALEPHETPRPRTGLGRVMSSRGPDVVEATWVPGQAQKRGGFDPLSVGIRHPQGPNAVPRLEANGLAVPEGWRLIQDHSKRGIVFLVPDGVGHAEVLEWLLPAASMLSLISLPTNWVALRYSY